MGTYEQRRDVPADTTNCTKTFAKRSIPAATAFLCLTHFILLTLESTIFLLLLFGTLYIHLQYNYNSIRCRKICAWNLNISQSYIIISTNSIIYFKYFHVVTWSYANLICHIFLIFYITSSTNLIPHTFITNIIKMYVWY